MATNYNDNSPSNDHDDQLHFVLIHGASHGGWCWYKIRALLEAAGHKATCLDLRCSGIDQTDFNTVFEFDDYNKPLTSFMSSLPPNQKVKIRRYWMSGGGDEYHFVLVHGASHGAWCWYKLRSLLESIGGHKVTCLDLTASGIDPHDPNKVLTLSHYHQPLFAFLSSLPPNQKVILVGHSAGGLSLTDVIQSEFAEKIQLAVYVAANMLKYGFRTDQDVKDGMPVLSKYGEISEVTYGFGPDQPPTSSTIKPQFQRQILYNMSPIQDSTLASMLLRPAPIRAFQGARFEGGAGADSVPRVYIKTLRDHIIKPEQQQAMINRWPPQQVFDLDSDHSPFFSTPDVLFDLLIKAARGGD